MSSIEPEGKYCYPLQSKVSVYTYKNHFLNKYKKFEM